MSTIPAGVDRSRIPFAVDGKGEVCSILVDGVENPHVVVTGGSQTGKTTMLRLICAYAASLGMIVVVFDPKWRWKGIFPFRLPHVLVFDSPEEWTDVVKAVLREMERRYRRDLISQEVDKREIIKNRDVFPGFLVIADEFGTMLGETDAWWSDTKEKGEPKVSPLHRGWQSLLWRGAEAGIVMFCAAHMAGADMFPAGTRSRQLHGQRIALGVDVEETSWPMLMGRGRERVEVPEGVRGAGAFLQGTTMRRIQVLFVETAPLAAMAAHGIEVLRSTGHLDTSGRLRLHTDPAVLLPRPRPIPSGQPGTSGESPVRLVRPGDHGVGVPELGPDDPSSSAGDSDSVDDPQGDGDGAPAEPDPRPAVEAEGLSVIGNPAAAEYLRVHFGHEGYNADRFRQDVKRKGVELSTEGRSGNQAIYSVSALRVWYRVAFPKGGQ